MRELAWAWAAWAGKKRVPEELVSELRPEGCSPSEQSGEGGEHERGLEEEVQQGKTREDKPWER